MIASIILLALQVVYSADGINPGSAIRECPSQAVNLRTGDVVIGLHSLTDIQRMECGWYRYVPTQKPDTNHYWRATNYVFTATGTVSRVWEKYHPKPKPVNYCKADIIRELQKINDASSGDKWELLKAAMVEADLLDLWNAATYIPADDPAFIVAKPRIQEILGMTEKQLDDLLNDCIY